MKKIVVVGSINMDLVTICERAPRGGETLLGKKFMQIPGGKGANQAVAMGKMKSPVSMLGKVGKEGMGDILLNSMKQNGVDVSNIEYCDEATGIAKIIVEENGQNRILVVPGANYEVDKLYIDKHLEVIKNSDIVVTQLEIPLETVKYTLQKAKEFGKITVLNPAPATKLDEDIISNSDYIIPNETELELLSGASITDENSVIEASKILLNKGVKGLIVTLGSKGCIFISKNEVKSFSAYKVKAIDTTAAGDSFIGGFINGLASGLNFDEAIDRGTKVAAISVTRIGAQTSIPTFEEVLNFKESII
ncbi:MULTISPECIES: ribokinase [Cetobacterium]|uniref:Ribokinase n=1 Tax=Candidatus Cetobacterium colombiensis TaxID=3073100 RepID=A0ABU4W905_9FUSO|nr:ribokinase [Candidatus Cetobacterium colombiensis]MDX8336015.1 ribokinase [Candidatus Cetobacterium colombiensis]